MNEYEGAIYERMQEAGIHFDAAMRHPLWRENGWGCVIQKPFGIKVVVMSTIDNDIDTSFLDEELEEDRDILANLEGYIISVVLLDAHGKEIDCDAISTTIDARETGYEITKHFGSIALDILYGLEPKIDAAVRAAGEHTARYI